MTIKHIKLTNWCGLSDIDKDLPAICLVQGKNETGKSSFLDAILYLWEKGHDDANITAGEQQAEIIATMADGLQVRAVLKRGDGTERMTKKPGAKRWTVSRAEIDALVNGIGYNPLEFMKMKPKEQLGLLLKLMPPTVSDDEMVAALKPAVALKLDALTKTLATIGGSADRDALTKIAQMRTTIYDERTGINRAADTQQKHAKELEESLGPPAEEKDWGVEVARLEAELAALREKKADAADTLRVHVDKVKAEASADYEAAVERLRQARDKRIEDARAYANKKWEEIEPGHEAAIGAVNNALAVARERDRLSASHASTRNAVQVAKQSALQMAKQSEALTTALANLDKLQASVAERLPIPGIRFIDGELHNEQGIPFRKWNTATQTTFCLRLAILMNSPFIVLDRGLEVLDSENQNAFIERASELAEERGIQFFFASITADEGLKVGEPATST